MHVPARPLTLAVLPLLLGLTLCAGLAGCVSQTDAAGITRIRMCFFGGYEEWKLWQGMKKAFEAENPDIRLKLHYWPGNYEDKLKLTFAARTAPDIISAQDEPFPAYVARGQFTDLTPYVKASGDFYSPARYFQTALPTFQIDGRQYAIPWDGGQIMIYYNRGLFKRLGVPEPDPNWTLDDFVETCKRLTGDDDGDGRVDHFGFDLSASWMYSFIPFLWDFGGDIIDPEMRKCTVNTPEGIATLQFLRDLRYRWHVSPQPGEMGAGTGGSGMFMTGYLGMQITGPWNLPFMRKTDLDWDVAHMPIGPGGRFTRGTWDALALYSGSKHKDAAWKFIMFATGPQGQRRVARSGRAMPPRKAQSHEEAFLRPDTPQHEEIFLEGMRYFRTQRMPVTWAEMNTVLTREYEKLMLPDGDARQVAAAMEREIDKELAAPPVTAY